MGSLKKAFDLAGKTALVTGADGVVRPDNTVSLPESLRVDELAHLI